MCINLCQSSIQVRKPFCVTVVLKLGLIPVSHHHRLLYNPFFPSRFSHLSILTQLCVLFNLQVSRALTWMCVSPVFVYDCVEELAVPPAAGEVVAAQALVPLHHPLGPQQQLLFGRHVVRLTVHLDV